MWPTKWTWCGMRGRKPPTHVSHLLSALIQTSVDPGCHISVTPAEASGPMCCLLPYMAVWLFICPPLYTQPHSPAMIHCLAAYGITLEVSEQTAARCSQRKILRNALLIEIPALLLLLYGDWWDLWPVFIFFIYFLFWFVSFGVYLVG